MDLIAELMLVRFTLMDPYLQIEIINIRTKAQIWGSFGIPI